jgi:FkbM family methyltransferase
VIIAADVLRREEHRNERCRDNTGMVHRTQDMIGVACGEVAALERFYAPLRSWPADRTPLDWMFEGTIEAIYTACLEAGDGAVDGGACHGRHTIPMARAVGDKGRVRAVEANPDALVTLERAVETYPNVSITHAALGPSDGQTVAFTVARSDPGRSALHIQPALTDVTVVDVPMTSIDRLAKDHPIAFVKLDLEGGELGALEGAERTLQRDAPVLCLEYNIRGMKNIGLDPVRLVTFLIDRGYALADIAGVAIDAESARWDVWRPNYLLALPAGTARSRRAADAQKQYTRRIYDGTLDYGSL